MSPRRSRRERPADAVWPLGPERPESWPDGDWVVRQIPGAAATKEYRCPGCDQEILPRTPHVVAWPAEAPGVDMRRHWHRTCWERRLTRRPGRH
ncbi:MAG TPA: ATP/GTP-binding protein [Streptosporangiaceae bacterium]